MILAITDVLTAPDVEGCSASQRRRCRWPRDGRVVGPAREIEPAGKPGPEAERLRAFVSLVGDIPSSRSPPGPRPSWARVLALSTGARHGAHVDDALMGGIRATSPSPVPVRPCELRRRRLVIDSTAAEAFCRTGSDHLSATTLHRVAPVTVASGWRRRLRSFIRDADRRSCCSISTPRRRIFDEGKTAEAISPSAPPTSCAGARIDGASYRGLPGITISGRQGEYGQRLCAGSMPLLVSGSAWSWP
jgi:hypothetical protein